MKIKSISKLFIFSAFILTAGIKTSFAQNIPSTLYINANLPDIAALLRRHGAKLVVEGN